MFVPNVLSPQLFSPSNNIRSFAWQLWTDLDHERHHFPAFRLAHHRGQAAETRWTLREVVEMNLCRQWRFHTASAMSGPFSS